MPSRYPGAMTQDGEPVVLRKPKSTTHDAKAVNHALRTGGSVQTVKKADAGSNKKAAPVVSARKPEQKAVNHALRTGGSVQTVKKADAGSNKKAAPVVSARKPEQKTVNHAVRTGGSVQTVKKADAGSNKKAAPVVSARKPEAKAWPPEFDRVPAEVWQAIQKAWVAKKMSQAELAMQIKLSVVEEYENGMAVPNQVVLAKMEKVLEVKLRGKVKWGF